MIQLKMGRNLVDIVGPDGIKAKVPDTCVESIEWDGIMPVCRKQCGDAGCGLARPDFKVMGQTVLTSRRSRNVGTEGTRYDGEAE